jgi:3-isopropylmalate/(R)-2-methylmalate dehydratase small subunit
MRPKRFEGRAWVLLDAEGRLIEDIDTDQIYHNAYLHITDTNQMGQYALGNLEGWKDFAARAKPGDIIVAGRNFGAGSSRQQAVDCFLALGVSLILAPSFAAIYYRNAVNSGFPVLICPGLEEMVKAGTIRTADMLSVNAATGRARDLDCRLDFRVEPMGQVQQDIFDAGNLFAYGRARGGASGSC